MFGVILPTLKSFGSIIPENHPLLGMVFYFWDMQITSTNIGNPTTFLWNGKEEKTGIFKYPVSKALYLGKTEVKKDSVIYRKHHGGIDKACFLFSADEYLSLIHISEPTRRTPISYAV